MIRIAFTSSDGRCVDEHFGKAQSFSIWQLDAETSECVGTVSADADTDDIEDKILRRAKAVEGCSILCTTEIGGPAAAKLVARRIHPMKTQVGTTIDEVVLRLQDVLRHRTPPWLRKALRASSTRSTTGGRGPV